MKLVLPISALAVVAIVLLQGAPLHAAPKVNWSLEQVEVKIAAEDKKPVRVTMTAQKDLPATRLETTPSLDGWVTSITPSELPPMLAGDEVTIDLVFSGGWVGVVDGTLKVRELSPPRTLATPLSIVIDGVATIEETLPPEPDPEENAATLLGVDSDGDGVRDDVQRIISLGWLLPAEREGLLDYARSLALIYSPATYSAAKQVLPSSRACLRALMGVDDGIQAYSRVHTEVINTLDRIQAYSNYDQSLRGLTVLPPDLISSCIFPAEDF